MKLSSKTIVYVFDVEIDVETQDGDEFFINGLKRTEDCDSGEIVWYFFESHDDWNLCSIYSDDVPEIKHNHLEKQFQQAMRKYKLERVLK